MSYFAPPFDEYFVFTILRSCMHKRKYRNAYALDREAKLLHGVQLYCMTWRRRCLQIEKSVKWTVSDWRSSHCFTKIPMVSLSFVNWFQISKNFSVYLGRLNLVTLKKHRNLCIRVIGVHLSHDLRRVYYQLSNCAISFVLSPRIIRCVNKRRENCRVTLH